MNVSQHNEDPWCRYLPLLHRILAKSAAANEFPRVSGDLSLNDACPVWETLHYLLRFLLGWEDTGAGLAVWYATGKPIDDSPLLQIVSELWDRNRQLDFYAAWAWVYGPQGHARDPLYHNVDWWKEFKRRSRPSGSDPFHGGSNPLHLGHSEWFGNDQPETDRAQLHFDTFARRAVLIVNQFGSWRRDLRMAEQRLPPVGERSWQVEVFDRQVGFLGLFRLSRVTGRWFQGKHRVHMLGRLVTATIGDTDQTALS